ncbi:unnamed protein product, partial [Notodromas monacha]
MIKLLVLTIALFAHCGFAQWSYQYGEEEQQVQGLGPNRWSELPNTSCGGKSQSPVDIQTAQFVGAPVTIAPLIFSSSYARAAPTMKVVNKVSLLPSNIGDHTVKGGGLPFTYTAADYHFHWGQGPHRGSENTINGKSFPLEMHAVHLSSEYQTVDSAKASKDPTALAVIAVHFEESETDNPLLAPLIAALEKLGGPNDLTSEYTLPAAFPILQLFPTETSNFYRFVGSLTTPPCSEVVTWTVLKRRMPISEAQELFLVSPTISEVVTWTVLKRRMPISEAQMSVLRDLVGTHGFMGDNFRPTQPLNTRKITRFVPASAGANALIDASGWSYEYGKKAQVTSGPGPFEWSSHFASFCGGSKQSPIDIDTTQFTRTTINSSPFEFNALYGQAPTAMSMNNDGHTVHLTTPDTGIKFIGGGLGSEYVYVDGHFHWGSSNGHGSEHTINGKPYVLEMHLVHKKATYTSVDAAKASKDSSALAVLGVLFELSENDNPMMTPIIDALKEIKTPGQSKTLTPFPIRTLLPVSTAGFYRYYGSLTTPPCNEVVAWTVFKEPMPISETQLGAFRDLLHDATELMQNNFRPIQPKKGRLVKRLKKNQMQLRNQNGDAVKGDKGNDCKPDSAFEAIKNDSKRPKLNARLSLQLHPLLGSQHDDGLQLANRGYFLLELGCCGLVHVFECQTTGNVSQTFLQTEDFLVPEMKLALDFRFLFPLSGRQHKFATLNSETSFRRRQKPSNYPYVRGNGYREKPGHFCEVSSRNPAFATGRGMKRRRQTPGLATNGFVGGKKATTRRTGIFIHRKPEDNPDFFPTMLKNTAPRKLNRIQSSKYITAESGASRKTPAETIRYVLWEKMPARKIYRTEAVLSVSKLDTELHREIKPGNDPNGNGVSGFPLLSLALRGLNPFTRKCVDFERFREERRK